MQINSEERTKEIAICDEDDCGLSTFEVENHEFYGIPEEIKKKLPRVMARIMERAYRRGVQQALFLNEKNAILPWILDDVYSYRYNYSLDYSVGLDGLLTTSQKRLDAEEGISLSQKGLYINE